MNRKVILATILGLFALGFASVISAQAPDAKIEGSWTATIHAPDKTMSETWTIKQSGQTITGTSKGDKGEMPVAGTIEGNVFRGLETDGDQHYQVHLTVDGNSMDGTIRMGKNEYLIMMKKK